MCEPVHLLLAPRHRAPGALDLALVALRIQSSGFGGQRRFRPVARLGPLGRPPDQLDQALHDILAIAVLATILPRIDDQHAVVRDLPPGQPYEALAHVTRERW